MPKSSQLADWVDPLLTGRNRVLTHTPLGAWPDRESARRGDASPFVRSLNGTWRFALTASPAGMPPGFTDPATDDCDWYPITVPSNWQLDPAVADQPIYTNTPYPFRKHPPAPPAENPTGWYRTAFDLPADWQGREIFLHFESCDSACKIWINGNEAGYSQDSKLPHEFNITALAKPGRNHLAVMVPRYCDGFWLECQDYWHLSGIQRDVTLYSKPKAHIRDVVVRTTFTDRTYTDAELFVVLYAGDAEAVFKELRGEIMLYDAAGAPVFEAPIEAQVSTVSPMYGDTQPEFSAAQFRVPVRAPRKWTPETPYLYTLVLTLVDAQGSATDFERCRVGFRQVEIRDRMLLLNGRRLPVRGVNAHEHHPERGRAMTAADMREELIAMKRLNINAVRTSHYPHHSAFYDLCDELGLAVVDEANLETHGVQALLSKDPLWMNAFMERAQRMLLRDRNHPCVIAWSLGNESYHGPHHAGMAAWMRQADPTRPVQYESGNPGPAISDIMAPMYPRLDWVRATLANPDEHRPLILCEYAYAKGNAGGNFKAFWDLVDELPSFQGGFIWDWRDKALVRMVNGCAQWAYGNEFDGGIGPDGFAYGKFENPQMCLNGIVHPDLSPKPAAWEIMQVQSPVQALVAPDQNPARGQFTLWNKHIVNTLAGLELRWRLLADGVVVREGALPAPETAPETKVAVDLGLDPAAQPANAECFLDVDIVLSAATPWAEAGHAIGWAQFPLAPVVASGLTAIPPAKPHAIRAETAADTIRVHGDGFAATFSREPGTLAQFDLAGRPLLAAGPRDIFYRARTDNDYILNLPQGYHHAWLQWGLDRLTRRVTLFETATGSDAVYVRIVAELAAPEATVPAIRCESLYHVGGDGAITVRNTATIPEAIAHLPRIGMELLVAPAFNRLEWYGRGPYENYADRKGSARVGRYRGTVAGQFVPYVDPCECGGKEDVRWLTLTDADGVGLRVRGLPLLHANAQHYHIADLVKAGHVYELQPVPEVVLHLDHRHSGVGGDTGWTPNIHEPYMIRPGVYQWAFRLETVL